MVAAVEAALCDRLEGRHTWTRRREVVSATAKLLRCPPATAEGAVGPAEQRLTGIPVGDGLQLAART